jgi:hypothetical protein
MRSQTSSRLRRPTASSASTKLLPPPTFGTPEPPASSSGCRENSTTGYLPEGRPTRPSLTWEIMDPSSPTDLGKLKLKGYSRRGCHFQYFGGSLCLSLVCGSCLSLQRPCPASSSTICNFPVSLSLIRTSSAIGETTRSASASTVAIPSATIFTRHPLG